MSATSRLIVRLCPIQCPTTHGVRAAHLSRRPGRPMRRSVLSTAGSSPPWSGSSCGRARSCQTPAELAQATMAEAYKYWSTIRMPEAWARRVASRALVRKTASVEDPVDEIIEPSPLLPPLTNVLAWEQRHEVLRLLGLLPPRQRQVMAWSLQGFTPAEIAEELQITGEAVRASLKKARTTLAQHLGTTGDEL
jgi:RNA polymerase sigma factor (sigma-70 family)